LQYLISPLIYMLDGEQLNVVSHQKDLGIMVDHQLKFHQHTVSVVSKANRVLGIISKSFECLDVDSLPRLCKALVCPIIEYTNLIWGPFYIGDQRMSEKVQKRATQLIPSLRDLPCSERLACLRLPSLYYRRKQGDMILVYQLLHGMLYVDASTLFTFATYTSTRGHNLKLCKP